MTVRDNTIEVQAVAEKNINNFKEQVLSGITHNLKTPLNGIIPMLESILKDQTLNNNL